MTSSPKWLMAYTAIWPELGLEKGGSMVDYRLFAALGNLRTAGQSVLRRNLFFVV